MTRDDIEKLIKQNKPLLEQEYNIHKIGLFGSYARNEKKGEDIDILVDIDGPNLLELKKHLESLFDKPVDLVTSTTLELKPDFKKNEILKEVRYQ